MKKKILINSMLIIISLIALLFLAAFVSPVPRLPAQLALMQVEVPPTPTEGLTSTQVILVGIIAMFVAQGIKLLTAALKKPIDRKWISVSLFVIALICAYFWNRPSLPALPIFNGEPGLIALSVLTFVWDLIAAGSALVGFGVLIYNLFMDKVFNFFGVGKDTITQLSSG